MGGIPCVRIFCLLEEAIRHFVDWWILIVQKHDDIKYGFNNLWIIPLWQIFQNSFSKLIMDAWSVVWFILEWRNTGGQRWWYLYMVVYVKRMCIWPGRKKHCVQKSYFTALNVVPYEFWELFVVPTFHMEQAIARKLRGKGGSICFSSRCRIVVIDGTKLMPMLAITEDCCMMIQLPIWRICRASGDPPPFFWVYTVLPEPCPLQDRRWIVKAFMSCFFDFGSRHK